MFFSLEESDIQYIDDEKLEGSVIIEQRMVAGGVKELFILKNIIQ